MKRAWWRAAAPLVVWLALAVVPPPGGLAPNAWRYFALFAAVVVGLILEPIPAAAVGLVGVTLAGVGRLVEASPAASIAWALSGFQDRTVWLIFGAFVFSIGYTKTGLGRRVALWLVRALGGRTLGLGYAIALADLALAPGTPSNTGRSAGVIFPVIRGIPGLYGSEPGPTARRIGSYVMWTAFAATAVTSSMFVTALAPNAAALALVKQATGLDITWSQWLAGFWPIGVLLLALVPLLAYVLYPPGIKTSEEVPAWAAQELGRMGAVRRQETVLAALVVLAVLLWIVGSNRDVSLPFLGSQFIDPTGVVLLANALMLVTGVVAWDDILGNEGAWNVLVWFATLVALADGLSRVGFVTWLARGFAATLVGIPPLAVMTTLVVFFFFVHYMFASLTAHAAAVLPVVLATGMAVPGLPVKTFALLLLYSLGLMGVVSPYATGPAPVYYGSGYVPRRDFWVLGLLFGSIYLAALLGIGIPYLTAVRPLG
ncbi:MAG TPA: DASS family sodium-coupled anion symporter [Vicinamibacteria bacterium]|nr:DASS family sodium-coupled anion symporter [Vicinamibacteria bacterium]